jgi:membrane protease YdiL (CAAX protease family)
MLESNPGVALMDEQNEHAEQTEQLPIRPELGVDDTSYQFHEEPVTYTEDELDKKWYGVPPKGERPFYNKWKYVFMLIGIIIIEIGIWAVYRYFTGVVLELQFGDHLFYFLHIIAAPTIHLLPIILFWWYVRKEKGLPFVFSKKLLLTGIIIGFMGAIIWRLLEEFLYFGFASAAGGTAGPLTFLNLLETADLFIIMTFVMYFIVGPVEELEFRSFVQDQGARALTNIQAVILSSVLFGCSHIPIAVFVYKLPPTVFADALFGWIAAGFTFGFLYMWSRNIFACIVMHGMGNWQLSVFYFAALPGNMEPTTAMIVGMATSFASNAIMIYIFYLIHKYYWEPHRHGEPAFGGKLMGLQKFLYDHDFERKPLPSTIAVFVIFIFLVSAMITGAAAGFGSLMFGTYEPTSDDGGSRDLESYVEVVEPVMIGDGMLNEGESTIIGNFTSEENKYIKSVSVTLTWIDEPDRRNFLRTYENNPDTFSLMVSALNVTDTQEGENPHGSEGSITATIDIPLEAIESSIDDGYENYGVEIEVTLVNAGDLFTQFGLFGYTDNSNTYSYEISVIWLEPD